MDLPDQGETEFMNGGLGTPPNLLSFSPSPSPDLRGLGVEEVVSAAVCDPASGSQYSLFL